VSRWSASRWFAPRLRVELRPGSLALVRRAALAGSRVRSTRAVPVEINASNGETATEPWRAAVDALIEALRELRGAVGQVEIVLSDHFVRYLLIPWSAELVGDSERLSFAQLAFRDLYGQLADTWDLCLDEQPAGQASFACAVDRALASSLRDAVERAGAQLSALMPSLADCINRHRSALKAPEFCMAVCEPGRISLALRARHGWATVRSRRVDGTLADVLPTLLKQEMAVGDVTQGGVLYVCTDDAPDAAPFAVPGWRTVRLAERGAFKKPAGEHTVLAAEG